MRRIDKLIEKARALPVGRGEEWVMERRAFDVQIEEMGEIRPDVLVCMSLKMEELIGARVVAPSAPDSEIEAWALNCMLAPQLETTPHRPQSITLTGGRLKHLQPTLEQAGIQTTARSLPHPLVSTVVSVMESGLNAPGLPPYLDENGIDADIVADFFSAARDFYILKPWEIFAGELPIRLVFRQKKATPYWAVIMGTLGQNYGLALYCSADDLANLLDSDNDEEALATAQDTWSLCLGYEIIDNIGPIAIAEAEDNKWVIADEFAYPSALLVDPKSKEYVGRPSRKNLILLTAAARALTKFISDHREEIDAKEFVEDNTRIQAAGDSFNVSLSIPAPEFAEDDDEYDLF